MNKKLILLFVSAFLIRLVALNQSLWLDETTTAKVVHTFSYLDIITKFSPTDFHPPLFYLVMKVWSSIFGTSEIALRMPSVLFSLGAGWFVYQIGKITNYQLRITNNKQNISDVGFWAAAFFLFNPLIVYYSQEARMYMMVTFLLAGASYWFCKLCHPRPDRGSPETRDSHFRGNDNEEKLSITFFNLFIFLSLLTFYGSVFYIAAMYLYLLYKKQFTLFFYLLPGFILSLLVISPLLSYQLIHSKDGLAAVKNWSLVLGKANVKNLALFPLKFSAGRISFYPKALYYVLAGGWTLVVMFFVFKGALQKKSLAFFLITPLLFGLLFSFFTPLLQYFRFLYLLIPMSLLLAIGCLSFPWKRESPDDKGSRIKSGMTILIGFIIWSCAYLFIPQFHREDWKSLAAQIETKHSPVYAVQSSYDPIRYYSSKIQLNDLKTVTQKPPVAKEIIVVPYVAEIYGIDYKKELMQLGFTLEKTHTVRELRYEEWQIK